MEKDNRPSSTNRRNFLVRGSLGVAAFAGLGAVPTAGKTAGSVTDEAVSDVKVKDNPDFDPDDPRAVREFVKRTFQWSNDVHENTPADDSPRAVIGRKRERVLEGLSKEQKQAVSDELDKSRVITRRNGRSDGRKSAESNGVTGDSSTEGESDVSTQSCSTYSDSITGVIKVPGLGEFTAFKFTQEIGWCVSSGKVGSVVPKVRATSKSYLLVKWDYAGKSDSTLSFHPEKYYAISYLEGRFTRCVLVNTSFSCVGNDYGYVEAVVHNDWSARTLSKGVF